jgi:hypothetical protein
MTIASILVAATALAATSADKEKFLHSQIVFSGKVEKSTPKELVKGLDGVMLTVKPIAVFRGKLTEPVQIFVAKSPFNFMNEVPPPGAGKIALFHLGEKTNGTWVDSPNSNETLTKEYKSITAGRPTDDVISERFQKLISDSGHREFELQLTPQRN